ncbi:MAG: phytanoyl-CoA dioxygenase family protein [Pseudomonadales bacterium]|jgi:ectoine hydroxylase-related dioxygenase (phytanoyl-CoA dioxygenase family)|nr:phytanoyl-CoA dioxygenase family protein [Pseudomonadales bacterium]MDP7596535.1 phytanoyl-CoA dioxygenase family protein [Pseudomonadales bacterium]HJN50248.1 phytanoyl-CoA dioxygenase family protein [Pseudomonadales bacterium]|tara:strand:- start:498 stop:1379 length:882 start_codon:yes stop_codon:yes gene_type:complete
MAQAQMQSDPLQRILSNIRELGLNDNLVELETIGYTTIKAVLSEEQIERAQEAILSRVESTSGRKVDIDRESGEAIRGMTYLPYLLYDDPVFEEILMQQRPLALITYLLGESCLLSSLGCHFKGPGGNPLVLHSDNGNGMPVPFSPISQVANVNYALTPYSREAGALALVAGSHKLARQPRPEEMLLGDDNANPSANCMDLSPGDTVVWHGNTWHGSFARQIPGIRMNLAVYFSRQYVQTQERHGDTVPEDVLLRHADDDRFKTLLGAKQPYGWQLEGPDYALMARNPRGLYD